MKAGGYRVLDTQFLTDHLKLFGAVEVPRARYHRMLTAALQDDTGTDAFAPQAWSGAQALAAIATD
jgi:leucyl/phenylalanyl-tRNA--protein transferase